MTDSPSELDKTPLDAEHRRLGARMVEFAGWEMPVQYGGVIEEHRAVRTRAGLFDVSHMGEIGVRGPGAERFLDRLTPNHVAALVPGRAHYSGLLTERGTYVDDLLVYRLGDEEFLLVVNAANATKDLEWILRWAADATDVEVTDLSRRYALLALQGPRAAEILAPLATVDLDALRYYRFAEGEVDGARAIVSRTGYTGEDGFELYVDPEDAPALWRRLLDSGSEMILPAGLAARDTLRLEASMALYGHEIDDTTTPWEAGLDWVVKLDQGDFVGRDALLEQKEEGVSRRLVGFEIVDRGIARQGQAVYAGEREIGAVTSGTFSPTLEKAIGMAYVPMQWTEPGSEIVVDCRGRMLAARVVEMPFYRRPKKKSS